MKFPVIDAARKKLLFFCLSLVLLFSAFCPRSTVSAEEALHPWAFQDGSMVAQERGGRLVLAFPYVPFLQTSPEWIPALPKDYGQPGEEVRPMLGLGGTLEIEFGEGGDKFEPLSANDLHSGQ